jgi:DNA-binding Lrp family transcriptional regulator
MNPFESSIESKIIQNLQQGALPSADLVSNIAKELEVSKQAVYKELRRLKRKEVVVAHGKILSLSVLWLQKMASFFMEAQRLYSGEATSEPYLEMEDGDSLVYRFANPNTMDSFWGHAVLILSEKVKVGDYIYLYNPHEWFLAARPESELEIFRLIHESNKNLIIYVSGDTPLDKKIGKMLIYESQQYFSGGGHLFPKENYYINIFDDFVIEAWIDPGTAKKIDKFFEEEIEVTPHGMDELQDIISQKGKNKFKISRNKRKAEQLKRKIGKYFHIKK